MAEGFRPPPYPYDRLDDLRPVAEAHAGGVVDLSIGTPTDPPAPAVVAALGGSDAERGYPPSIGSAAYREAAVAWMARRLGITVDPGLVGACVGTKEFVVATPNYLRLRRPDRDTVLHPRVAYPSYEMGATLGGCRAVAVPPRTDGALDLEAITDEDAARAVCLWVNSPANPSGALDDLGAAAAWGRAHDVPVLSDECYVEFTWEGPPRTILEHGPDAVLALHSLSKRSNLAGVRAGFYAGDGDLVEYLREVRKHAGLMVPGPVQAAAVAAWADDGPVDEQRSRYRGRLELMRDVLTDAGVPCGLPAGAFYLWVEAPDGDAWALTRRLAAEGGALVAPGEFYGDPGRVRVAVVQSDERLALVGERLAAAR